MQGTLPQEDMRRIGLPWSPELVTRTLIGVGSAVLVRSKTSWHGAEAKAEADTEAGPVTVLLCVLNVPGLRARGVDEEAAAGPWLTLELPSYTALTCLQAARLALQYGVAIMCNGGGGRVAAAWDAPLPAVHVRVLLVPELKFTYCRRLYPFRYSPCTQVAWIRYDHAPRIVCMCKDDSTDCCSIHAPLSFVRICLTMRAPCPHCSQDGASSMIRQSQQGRHKGMLALARWDLAESSAQLHGDHKLTIWGSRVLPQLAPL